jgi:hypothetical protein
VKSKVNVNVSALVGGVTALFGVIGALAVGLDADVLYPRRDGLEVLAAIGASVADGIRREATPPNPIEGDAYALDNLQLRGELFIGPGAPQPGRHLTVVTAPGARTA